MKRLLLLLLLIPAALQQTAYGGVIVENAAERKGTVYLLSIGFSPLEEKPRESTRFYENCTTCITDAKGFAAYFQKLHHTKSMNADTVITYVYTSNITLDTLYSIFDKLQKRVRPEDVFIFYYASIAWGIQTDETGNQEGYYIFNTKYGETGRSQGNSFTLRHLKTLTDRIAAQRQLIIFDTGMGDVIQPDYYRNFFSDNLAEATFSKKNRIIVCPEKASSETFDQKSGTKKGDMFRLISNLPDSFNVLRLFDTTRFSYNDPYKKFMKYWYDNQVGLMVQVKILKETDYLKILSAIKEDNNSGKRGFSIKTKLPEIDSNIVNRKKKVLIVATGDYNAPSWKHLRNPVNDGRDAEKVFRTLGYEVKALYNQPKDSILSALSELVDNEVQNPYSQHIIYFAGHGFYDARQKAGYIVCHDSREMKDMGRPSMTELGSYIDYTVLFRSLDQLNKVILITDVCFGGTSVNSLLQGSREANPNGEADKLKNPFKKVLASGIKEVDDFIRLHNGTVSDNSPFAAAFLDVLKKQGALSFEELYAKLKANQSLSPTPIESSFGTEKIPNSFTF
jgi:hypothetical protein